MDIKAESDLFLHQILQMCDPLRILWVTADVILIKERLLSRRMSQKVMISNTSSIHTSTQIQHIHIKFSPCPSLPLDI